MSNIIIEDGLRVHCLNTMKICNKLLSSLGKTENRNAILKAAELHDIGKKYIPKEILNSVNPLTEIEKEVMSMHTVYGYMMMKEAGYDELSSQLVLLHHGLNRYLYIDSSSLLDDAIIDYPILMASDMLDALCSDRCYRKAISKKEALNIISKCAEIPDNIIDALKYCI